MDTSKFSAKTATLSLLAIVLVLGGFWAGTRDYRAAAQEVTWTETRPQLRQWAEQRAADARLLQPGAADESNACLIATLQSSRTSVGLLEAVRQGVERLQGGVGEELLSAAALQAIEGAQEAWQKERPLHEAVQKMRQASQESPVYRFMQAEPLHFPEDWSRIPAELEALNEVVVQRALSSAQAKEAAEQQEEDEPEVLDAETWLGVGGTPAQ